jgi:uncharacterized membrane protein
MSVLSRHARFLAALTIGGALGLACVPLGHPRASLVAVNGFFLCYLALMLRMTLTSTPATLKRRAEDDDEGIVLILVLALAAVAVSLAAILQVLSTPGQGALTSLLSLTAVPLGWAVVQTLAGYRYAHLFYAGGATPGLSFPGTPDPGPWDFLYLAFGVGMTAQVSDVVVTSPSLRRLVMLHSVGAFFYNTVILALAVNAGLVLGGAES